MKTFVILDCCGYEVKTNSKNYEYIECFKTQKNKFFRKKLKDGRDVNQELLLITVCPKCKHLILKYLWYAKRNTKFQYWDDSKIIRGLKADEVFSRRCGDYSQISLPNPFKARKEIKYGKKIPMVYYKSIDGFSQIPRYINEADDAGLKVVCEIKKTNLYK